MPWNLDFHLLRNAGFELLPFWTMLKFLRASGSLLAHLVLISLARPSLHLCAEIWWITRDPCGANVVQMETYWATGSVSKLLLASSLKDPYRSIQIPWVFVNSFPWRVLVQNRGFQWRVLVKHFVNSCAGACKDIWFWVVARLCSLLSWLVVKKTVVFLLRVLYADRANPCAESSCGFQKILWVLKGPL